MAQQERSGVYRKCGKMQFECESSCLGKEDAIFVQLLNYSLMYALPHLISTAHSLAARDAWSRCCLPSCKHEKSRLCGDDNDATNGYK